MSRQKSMKQMREEISEMLRFTQSKGLHCVIYGIVREAAFNPEYRQIAEDWIDIDKGKE